MARRIETVWAGAIGLGALAMAGALVSKPESRAGGPGPRAWPAFVNFETPQVHPIEITPDGLTLLVCNTAAARIDVFSIASGWPTAVGSVPVGLDPVSVRARTSTEVWVANHVSDSVSVVDLVTMNVVKTLKGVNALNGKALDEPCDIAFAGTPQRAFVTFSQSNVVAVWDLANLDAAPTQVVIDAEDPRSLAVSPDGETVYAAAFESGNGSTLVGGGAAVGPTIGFPPNAVSDAAGPYGGVNPPPNKGAGFEPPIAPANLPAVPMGLIVKKDGAGKWMDDNGHDWTSMVSGANAGKSGRVVGWDMPDRDVAAIDANSLSVTYATGLMNMCMSVEVNPATGAITVIGTEATNEVRFEPNVKGKFIRVEIASVEAGNLASKTITDLNPHLDYSVANLPQSERDRSIGDPRAVVWRADGQRGYVAGMGSNNVIVVDSAGGRAGIADHIDVGEGPTGLALDEARGTLYVLNRFAASVSAINVETETVVGAVPLFDPTPSAIKIGRKHLYDTHLNSGLGQIACASCHVDGRIDRLAWDLGDPAGSVAALTDLNLGFGLPGLDVASMPPPVPQFAPHHPMKGPTTTQTMQDIIGKEPLHWRADRAGLESFAGAFQGLQGDDAPLDGASMQEFENFLATIYFPPNPFRNFDNTLPTSLPLPGHYRTGRFGNAGQSLPNGNAVNGQNLFRGTTNPARLLDNNALACVTCHTLPTGAGPDARFVANAWQPIPIGANGQHHLGCVSTDGLTNVTIKVPQFRNAYEKSGCNFLKPTSNAGFGFVHDGSVDSIERFVNEPIFRVNSDQETANLVAFVLCIAGSDFPTPNPNNPLEPPGAPSQDVPASVGAQVTLNGPAGATDTALLNSIFTLANANKVGFVAKGLVGGVERGYSYLGAGNWQSDRAGEQVTSAQLQALAAPGAEITFTVVPKGSETRLGTDADLDGCRDGDEGVVCDCLADYNGDAVVSGVDIDQFTSDFEAGDPRADVDGNGFVNGEDFDRFIAHAAAGC